MSFQEVVVSRENMVDRMKSRMLDYFRKAPVEMAIIEGFASEIQALMTAIQDVQDLRTPAKAGGVNLDALGRIVGQDRILMDYSLIAWFAPDVDGQGPDQAPIWVTGAPLTESLLVDDIWYRLFIEAKIFRNHTKYGSIPEIQQAAKMAFNIDISFIRTGPMQVFLVIPRYFPLYVFNLLKIGMDPSSEINNLLLPYPMTLSFSGILFFPEEVFFAPDIAGHGPDVAEAAVAFTY